MDFDDLNKTGCAVYEVLFHGFFFVAKILELWDFDSEHDIKSVLFLLYKVMFAFGFNQ